MFDRVVCINLTRRADRWRSFQARLPQPWPFREVERIAAIDGHKAHPPRWFGAPPATSNHPPNWRKMCQGPWGCMRSHVRVWEECLSEDVRTCLVLEDDALFVADFAAQVEPFLGAVPSDWDQIYLGGQHLNTERTPPHAVNERVIIGRNVNRTHAYAINHAMMAAAYQAFASEWEGARMQDWHIDHRLGAMHETGEWNVYAPHRWLVGQAGGRGDVKPPHQVDGNRWWNEFAIC